MEVPGNNKYCKEKESIIGLESDKHEMICPFRWGWSGKKSSLMRWDDQRLECWVEQVMWKWGRGCWEDRIWNWGTSKLQRMEDEFEGWERNKLCALKITQRRMNWMRARWTEFQEVSKTQTFQGPEAGGRIECSALGQGGWCGFALHFLRNHLLLRENGNESVLERIDFLSTLERFEVYAIPAMRKRKLIPL